jgi:Zn-dependent protease
MPLFPGQRACPACGALVHRRELEQLAAEAQQFEETDPARAAHLWRQALGLLPADAQQARMVAARADALAGPAAYPPPAPYAPGPYPPGQHPPADAYGRPAGAPRGETWQSVLLKTGGSMALSVLLYSQMGGWQFAVAFVLLIFVHEMGHVVANWYFGIRQSAPIFMGIFGAVIFIRGRIRNAWEEAVMGIAGPVFGSVAALACYAWFLKTGSDLARDLAFYGLFLNAFNLLPVPPLDGGRTAAAISPWLWPAGVVGLGLWIARNVVRSARAGAGGFDFFWLLILFWILSQTWARVRLTLAGGQWRSPYYQVGTTRRVAILVVYVGLAIVLLACLRHLHAMTGIGI